MSFLPAIPAGGYAGWTFLKRTKDSQVAGLASAPQQKRDIAHFRDKIGSVVSADMLVADKRLLRVALTAFGLEGDLGNTAFIRKVLADGTLEPGDLPNRLADKRYRDLSEAFGFGNFSVPRTRLSDFADKIVAAFEERQFEAAVGNQHNDLRLALNAERELAALANRGLAPDTAWLTVIGSPPLRSVFHTAFSLPPSFAAINLDQQVESLRTKAAAALGDSEIAQFREPAAIEKLLKRFLLRNESASFGGTGTPGGIALQLLQSRTATR